MAYYKIIGGSRYDRALLDAADACTQGRGESRISLEEIQQLYQLAGDGGGLTEIERKTLVYIARHYHLTDKAGAWLSERLQTPGEHFDTTIERVLRQEYRLPNLHCSISAETVRQYESGGGSRDWEAALRGAVEAYLHNGHGSLSFVACVARRDLAYSQSPNPDALVKAYLDRGTLFLIPPGSTPESQLPYDLAAAFDSTYFWAFALQCPDFAPVEFFAFVHRDQALQYNRGQFSRKAGFEPTIHAAVRQFALFDRLKWALPEAEIERQLAILPGQNFGNALFAALNTGIFNQESSTSFGDFIREEIWPDPEVPIAEKMREYANAGTLHLIPLDYRAQTDAGTAAFPVPPQFSFPMEDEWIFGLEMPGKTQVRLLLNTPRNGNDGDTAWSDGFIDDPLPLTERLQRIVTEEFKLDGLELRVHEAEYEQQRQQFGPDWRHLPGLLRQALNTLLGDYLTPNSMFNWVAKANLLDVEPAYFDDPKEYRAAIRHLMENYLRDDAVLELLPYSLADENTFPNGETVADNWLMRAVAESLADHWFWIVLPRWPEDGQLPYNYIG